MRSDPAHIYIWQRIISPHMAGLANALAHQGHMVSYVAEREMSADRANQGWQAPRLDDVQLLLAKTETAAAEIATSAPVNSVHICQGIRGNGVVRAAQATLGRRGLQQWVVMETVDDSGFSGILKRMIYRCLFWHRRNQMTGVLATGWRTPEWVVARGVAFSQVFPFAYYLPSVLQMIPQPNKESPRFQFIFVGQLIERKQVGLLINALACIDDDFELLVIGDGPCRRDWEGLAEAKLPGRIRWLGQLPMSEIPSRVSNSDCLVLPSRHDGWGAVVSEALMVGTPVICSDACGAAGVVRASGIGGVFASGNVESLIVQLKQTLRHGSLGLEARKKLMTWAQSLGADAGARYLSEILAYHEGQKPRPQAPWQSEPIDWS